MDVEGDAEVSEQAHTIILAENTQLRKNRHRAADCENNNWACLDCGDTTHRHVLMPP